MGKIKVHYVISAMALTMLGGCGEGTLSDRIGLERKPPDEFRVLSRPPLTVPPEFNLRPPSDVAEGKSATKQAETLLFGEEDDATSLRPGSADTAVTAVETDALGTSGDENFLSNAGAQMANPNIRDLLRQENKEDAYPEDKSFLEKLREPANKEPMVDAAKEAERIKQNEAQGKAIDEGDTPTKKPKDRGVLDKIL